MTDSHAKWIGRTIVGVFLAHIGAIGVFGERLNQNQLLGCLWFWGLLSSWSVGAFWYGALPCYKLRNEMRWMNIPCRIAEIALVVAFLQIPLWSLITQQFPPDHFSTIQSYVATAGILFCLIGPMAPGLALHQWFIRKK